MPTRTQSNKQQDSQKHNCYFSKKNQEFFIYFHEESDIPSHRRNTCTAAKEGYCDYFFNLAGTSFFFSCSSCFI